jgi:hypothetical protein
MEKYFHVMRIYYANGKLFKPTSDRAGFHCGLFWLRFAIKDLAKYTLSSSFAFVLVISEN